MSPQDALAIFAAGLAAGTVNVIVGSGSLITFPTLLALGYPPVLANVSNTVGLVPGSVSAVVAYRRELVGQRRRLLQLGSASLLGGCPGPSCSSRSPTACSRPPSPPSSPSPPCSWRPSPGSAPGSSGGAPQGPRWGRPPDRVSLTGVYGGYFGAAQGVILIALLAIFIDDDLQRLNGTKNVLALIVNAVAGLLFVATTHISWSVAGLIAAGSIIGGQVGGRYGRRLPARLLRGAIVIVGLGVAVGLAIEWH